MSATKRKQAGAAMVEMAITLSLFMMLVFGVVEFGLAYFDWARTNEAARDAVRYAIVNDPVTDISGLTCPGGAAVTTDCTGADCAALLGVVQRIASFVPGAKVQVTYECSDAGNPARPNDMKIPAVTVRITGIQHQFVVPGILGFTEADITLPEARATRTGEDLFTGAGGG